MDGTDICLYYDENGRVVVPPVSKIENIILAVSATYVSLFFVATAVVLLFF